jgi:hypothetical protein
MAINDQHVPVRTVQDALTGAAAPVTRDFETLEIPRVQLDLAGIAVLREALDAGEAEILAYLEREAEKQAEERWAEEMTPEAE